MPKKFTENADEKTDDNKTFILVGSDEKSDDEFRVFGIVGDINEEKLFIRLCTFTAHAK